MVICLEHVVQLMPLPPVTSRFIKIQNGLTGHSGVGLPSLC